MSEFNGRRAPNFSQYINDLNAIPSPYDQAVQQQQQQQDSFNLDADLSLFTNAEFFDFDKFGDLNLPAFDAVEDGNLKTENKQNAGQRSDMEFLDLLGGEGFGNMPEYSAPEFGSVNPQSQQNPLPNFSAIPQIPNGGYNATQSPSQSSASSPPSATPSQAPASVPTPTASTPTAGPKRKNTQKTPTLSVEEAARNVAEEDKRRRNTAASARFRVKKKMREQALEKTVKETTDKNTALEARVTALELENQWLKNLITEKNGQSAQEEKKSETDIANMFKKFLASQKASSDRSSSESKIGVGTA
ncbi:putative bZIP transcription factor (MetR) [Aspergillus affinis]|uniref:putative bZIP transcription factor (MetR) n=1 Tax=Aspergillus affinis TaxID=1070780 RepID=UPI0022FE7EDC|nr:putative bZIP transcription factor [Aspergillus affinis]KAI9042590.1 putative bZIP transcription factor [Aspergillus affinis]